MTEPATKPAASETVRAVAASFRFWRMDRTAAAGFDPSPRAALRSFMAALYGVPFYAGVLALDLWHSADRPADLGTYALVQAIAYVIHTAGFPLAVLGMLRAIHHAEQWPLFVTAQNWFGLTQVAALLATLVLDQSHILGPVGAALLVGLQFYLLFIEGFIAAVTLGITPLACFAIVLLDVVFGVGIDQVAVSLF